MSSIEIKNVTKIFKSDNKEYKALDDINLKIDEGEFVCLLGPSGCGKSTLLNMMAGFEKPTEGQIIIDNEEVDKPRIDRLTIFQDYGLLPWRSVEKNVELGLESLKIPKNERKEISEKYIKLVGLEKFKNHYPSELSGGMKQRVAIARALASTPKILFMDEPFGALDPITRVKLQEDILKIHKEEKMTVIFVTHDVEEAVYLGSKIVILSPNPGKITKVMENDLSRTDERSSSSFYLKKDEILHVLEQNLNKDVEFYI
ncbi:MAG: ABC transporter ATP-binding protein [Clostridium sp.]